MRTLVALTLFLAPVAGFAGSSVAQEDRYGPASTSAAAATPAATHAPYAGPFLRWAGKADRPMADAVSPTVPTTRQTAPDAASDASYAPSRPDPVIAPNAAPLAVAAPVAPHVPSPQTLAAGQLAQNSSPPNTGLAGPQVGGRFTRFFVITASRRTRSPCRPNAPWF